MQIFLLAIAVLLVSGLMALFSRSRAPLVSMLGVVIAAPLGLYPAITALLGREELFTAFWSLPSGAFSIYLDPLAGVFLLPLFIVAPLASIYGVEYLAAWRYKRRLGLAFALFNLLIASIAMVITAHDGLLFLISWEVMSLSSYFLVVIEDENKNAREAGWTYLVATHIGTACIIALFVLVGAMTNSLDFDEWLFQANKWSVGWLGGLFFLLALIGFGTKAGIVPFHVWLPEAHPAAPSHVSAIMSGVMIKTGIYGLCRYFSFQSSLPLWWGWALVIVGVLSGLIGVIYAAAQTDIKRLLGYCSIENIGIIIIGLGLGIIGSAYNQPALAALGFGGAFLHVLNHALFKSLLFLGAGAVFHATGKRGIDELGGLLNKLPITGLTFAVGSFAIAGLPPLNGFFSEFLVYLGALKGAVVLPGISLAPTLIVLAGLALIGSLAAATFTKAFGAVFLGEPRSEFSAHEPGRMILWPMVILVFCCVGAAACCPGLLLLMSAAILKLVPNGQDLAAAMDVLAATRIVMAIVAFAWLFIIILAGVALWRYRLSRHHPVASAVTWDCGYAQPTPRMQYTASSFIKPLLDVFTPMIHSVSHSVMPEGYFPSEALLVTRIPDFFKERVYLPIFRFFGQIATRLHFVQHGRIQLYILYVALTMLFLLILNFGFGAGR